MQLEFEFLADRPDALPIVSRWYYDAWGDLAEGDSIEMTQNRLRDYLNRDAIPFAVLATHGDETLGVAQLKHHELIDVFPDEQHWLGGVYVAPAYRRRGCGSRLIEHIAAIAPEFGATTLYLQTEALDGGVYARLGWSRYASAKNHGRDVVVMVRHLQDPPRR